MSASATNQPHTPPPRRGMDFSMNIPLVLTAVGLMLIGCWIAWYFLWGPFPVDSAIPHYTKAVNVSGKLVSVGSGRQHLRRRRPSDNFDHEF